LICEDDRLIAMGWAAMLADGGYTVVGPAHSAEKALKMAYQHLPSLALIDIDLGGTIDGISLAAELAPLGILAQHPSVSALQRGGSGAVLSMRRAMQRRPLVKNEVFDRSSFFG
jgi:DNA-binding NarL/FixJ family response regulator